MIWHRPQRWKQLVTPPVEIVIAQVRLYKPWDGDSGLVYANFRRRSNWLGAQVIGIRLKGYRAREKYDNAPVDPAGFDRLPGREAAAMTTDLLTRATMVLAEFTGLNSFEREVCDVWLSVAGEPALQPFGPMLVARHVAVPGTTIGVSE